MIEDRLRTLKKAYDLILIDVNMPVMNGIDATKRIRLTPGCEKVPIVALTADVSDTCRQSCLRAGVDNFCTKPYSISNLVGILTNIVESKYTVRKNINQH